MVPTGQNGNIEEFQLPHSQQTPSNIGKNYTYMHDNDTFSEEIGAHCRNI